MNKKKVLIVAGTIVCLSAVAYFFCKSKNSSLSSDNTTTDTAPSTISEQDKKMVDSINAQPVLASEKDMSDLIEAANKSGNNWISLSYQIDPEQFKKNWDIAKLTTNEYDMLLKFISSFKNTMNETLKLFTDEEKKVIKSATIRLRGV